MPAQCGAPAGWPQSKSGGVTPPCSEACRPGAAPAQPHQLPAKVTFMKRPAVLAAFVFSFVLAAAAASAQNSLGWPRTVQTGAGTLVMFQPHVDSWDSDLVWRQAFQLTPTGGAMRVGAASFQGMSTTHTDTRIITVSDIQLSSVFFPGPDGPAPPSLVALLGSLMPPTLDLSLERLVTYMRTPASMKLAPPAASAPVILVSYAPAVVLRINGAPALTALAGTHLSAVTNTSWPLFQDSRDKRYFLLVNKLWLEARSLDGPWTHVTRLPPDFSHLPGDAQFGPVAKQVPPAPLHDPLVPEVLHTTTAADVILFDGKPVYAPVPGTQLERATNTQSPVFRLGSAFYYLTAGRWYSAANLKGPWGDVTASLPPDFASIPPDSHAGAVLAAVPGTTQAEDAALLSQVPKAAATAAQNIVVHYFNDPQFAPVEGTTMQYATDTTDKVLLIGNVYYLSRHGAWYLAPTPNGPWAQAARPPEVIYTIPPGVPLYTVTYAEWGYWGQEQAGQYTVYGN
jgi:hypothetical protein